MRMYMYADVLPYLVAYLFTSHSYVLVYSGYVTMDGFVCSSDMSHVPSFFGFGVLLSEVSAVTYELDLAVDCKLWAMEMKYSTIRMCVCEIEDIMGKLNL